MTGRIFGFVLCAVLLLGCKTGNKTSEKVFKGYILLDGEYTTFTDCATGREYWVEDKSGSIAAKYNEVAKKPFQPVYFEFTADLLPPATSGPASAYDNIMAVNEVKKYAAGAPDAACKPAEGDIAFDCSGNNPKWAVSFTEDFKFTASMPNDTLVFFPLAQPVITDSAGVGRVFKYDIGNENFQNITLIVTEAPCKDATGKPYRYSAKAFFGGMEFNGCARLKINKNENNPTSNRSTAAGGL